MELSIYNNSLRRLVLLMGIIGGICITISAFGQYIEGVLLPGVSDNLNITIPEQSTLLSTSIGVIGIIIAIFHAIRWKSPMASFRRLGLLLFAIITYFSFQFYISPMLAPSGIHNSPFFYLLLSGNALHGFSTSFAILLCSVGSRA